jgi:deoxycytidine triphosphate deaminase
MILSNRGLQEALDAGDVVIDPEPTPRSPTEGASCPYDTCSVNLRLGNRILIPKLGKPFSFDLRHGKVAPFLAEVYEEKEIDDPEASHCQFTSSHSAIRWSAFMCQSERVGLVTPRALKVGSPSQE